MNMSMSERQELELHRAAGLLPPARCTNFIRSVENHSRDQPYVTGSALQRAINLMLSGYGVSAPPNKEKQR